MENGKLGGLRAEARLSAKSGNHEGEFEARANLIGFLRRSLDSTEFLDVSAWE